MTAPMSAPMAPLTKKQQMLALTAALKKERSSFETLWRDIADHTDPTRAQFTITERNRGDRRNTKIIDPTATLAARTLAFGLHSGLTSPARRWFRLTTADPALAESGAIKAWLHEVEQRIAAIFARSNLYQALPTLYGDLGSFGTAAMGVFEDDETVIRCCDYPIGTYYLALDGRRRVRVFAQNMNLTVRQLVGQFARPAAGGKGIDWTRFSSRVKDLYERRQYEEVIEVWQVVQPNDEYDPSRLEGQHKRFASCYFEAAGEHDRLLEESGYDEFPILAARWAVAGNDVYGTNAPGIATLGDVKQLQLMEKKGLKALDKMIDPPLQAPTTLQKSVVSGLPGHINYHDARDAQGAIRPVHEVNVRHDLLEAKSDRVRQRIDRGYFADLFLMLAYSDPSRGSQPVTAREIEERREEKFIALGPVLERVNQDVLAQLIDRTFGIMERRGLIPEAPEELEGQDLKVEYESVLVQAQKRVGLAGFHEFTNTALRIAEVNPAVLDKVDFEQGMDELGTMLAVPPRLVRSDDDVLAIREQRAQAEQAAQAAAVAKDAASAAASLGSVKTNEPNLLSDLISGAGGGMPRMGAGMGAGVGVA